MLKQKTIVFIATVAWGRNWQRQHEWASRLAQFNRVLYIAPFGMTSMGPLTVLKKLRAEQHFTYNHELSDLAKHNLEHLRLAFIPIRNNRWLNALNAHWMSWQLRKRGVVDGNNTIIWACNPADTVVALTERYPRSRVVYDIAMRFVLLPDAPVWLLRSQAALARRANTILYDAEAELLDLPADTHYKANYVPQGFDEKLLQRAVKPHPRAAQIPQPQVVYIGSGYTALDVVLLKKLVTEIADLHLVMLGDFNPPLFRHPRVHWLGPVNRCDKDSYLVGAAAGLIPYLVNDYTSGTFPTKLFEYLALGLPVVSTALPEVLKFNKHVLVTASRAEFVSALRQALSKPYQRDDAFLAQHSWQKRFEKINQILAKWYP
ncbi:MAG: glycosyltransferase [Parcubacteria group bacterium]